MEAVCWCWPVWMERAAEEEEEADMDPMRPGRAGSRPDALVTLMLLWPMEKEEVSADEDALPGRVDVEWAGEEEDAIGGEGGTPLPT